jgi:hypothetical protein
VGLLARGIEIAGIATTLASWSMGFGKNPLPPRAVYTRLNRGATLGNPGDSAQQQRVLDATLGLLAQNAPAELVLDERGV